MNSATPSCSGLFDNNSWSLSKFNKFDLIEFLIIFLRWLKVAFTTLKNSVSLHAS
jgi:hypothetical protein